MRHWSDEELSYIEDDTDKNEPVLIKVLGAISFFAIIICWFLIMGVW